MEQIKKPIRLHTIKEFQTLLPFRERILTRKKPLNSAFKIQTLSEERAFPTVALIGKNDAFWDAIFPTSKVRVSKFFRATNTWKYSHICADLLSVFVFVPYSYIINKHHTSIDDYVCCIYGIVYSSHSLRTWRLIWWGLLSYFVVSL